jgi:hypothetical protein
MLKVTYQEFADAIDIVAIHNGDKRLTREQSANLKQVQKTTGDIPGNQRPRDNPLTHNQVKWAEEKLGPAWLAFLTVKKAVTDRFPTKDSKEDPNDYFNRLKHEAETDDELWKKGLLSGAIFKPAPWITGLLAQDHGCQIGLGSSPERNVSNARRVHVEAEFRFKDDPPPKAGQEPTRYVIYPQAIQRLDGPLEIGKTGILALETIENAGWKVFNGFVTSSRPLRRAILPPVNEEDTGGAQPLPGPR